MAIGAGSASANGGSGRVACARHQCRSCAALTVPHRNELLFTPKDIIYILADSIIITHTEHNNGQRHALGPLCVPHCAHKLICKIVHFSRFGVILLNLCADLLIVDCAEQYIEIRSSVLNGDSVTMAKWETKLEYYLLQQHQQNRFVSLMLLVELRVCVCWCAMESFFNYPRARRYFQFPEIFKFANPLAELSTVCNR